MKLVFVYGTLKQDGPNHFLLRGDNNHFIGQARTVNPVFDLLSLGKFPALVEGSFHVLGELYEIDEYTENRIDRLELGLYQKILTPIEVLSADNMSFSGLVYMWDHKAPHNPQTDEQHIVYDKDRATVMWINDNYSFD